MHELSLMQSLVDAVEAQTEATRVLSIRLEVGRLTAVIPDALRFCFDVCTRGTRLDGATLELVEVPGRARCRECDAEIEIDTLIGVCPCGSIDVDITSGRELRIREVEVA
jgi:hydrogenase nickel incorporation protein HypA/HybF